jgi:hypothetical protein
MKKIVLFAAAGMLTTATIVYATKTTERKSAKKEVTVKKDHSCTRSSKRTCIF